MASPARAQVPAPSADDPVLAALVEEALARSPDLRAAEQAVAAGRARPVQLRSLPDPMLSLLYTNDGWPPSLGERDMTTLGFMWSQDLPFPGKRRLRGEIAGLEADGLAQQLERARLSLVAAVKRAYYDLRLFREVLSLVDEQEETLKEIEGVARARYAVGQGAQQDVLRVQVELTRIGQLRAEQQASEAIRQAELSRLLGRPADAPIETPARSSLRPLGRALPELAVEAEARSPELKGAGLTVDRERLAVQLARKQSKPDFAVQAGYMNRGGLDPMWQAGVGVSLPVYRARRAAAQAEAEARAQEGERRVEAVRLQLRYRTQERLAQLEAAEKTAALYGNGIIPQDQMSVEAAIASYQAGKVPFLAVLEALGTLYADRTTYLRLLAGQEKTRASLEEASLEATSDLAEMATTGSRAMAGAARGLSGGMGSTDAGPMR